MSEPQILCRMCDNSVNKAVHDLATILLVRLVGQPPKNVKNEICPHRCFAFYTRTARLMGMGPKQYLRQRKTSTVVRARMLTVATTPPVTMQELIDIPIVCVLCSCFVVCGHWGCKIGTLLNVYR